MIEAYANIVGGGGWPARANRAKELCRKCSHGQGDCPVEMLSGQHQPNRSPARKMTHDSSGRFPATSARNRTEKGAHNAKNNNLRQFRAEDTGSGFRLNATP